MVFVRSLSAGTRGAPCHIPVELQHVKQIQFQSFSNPTAANRYPNPREFWVDDIQLY